MMKSTLSLIAAYCKSNRCIGKNNALPWDQPAAASGPREYKWLQEFRRDDLRRFKRITLGRPLIMGYRTRLSLGRPLPDRHNLVLSRIHQEAPRGGELFHCPAQALHRADELNKDKKREAREIMIIGGAEIFLQLLDQAQRMYITQLEKELDGDAFFPEYDEADWREEMSERKEYGDLAVVFKQLVRI